MPAASPKPQKSPQANRDRRSWLALIHLARKQLAIPEDAYRDLLQRVTGKRSAADLSPTQLRAVGTELRRLGFTDRPKRTLREGQHRKILVLWRALAKAGAVKDGSGRALDAFVRRQTGVERLEWLDAAQSNRVIEALKSWGKRIDEAQVPG